MKTAELAEVPVFRCAAGAHLWTFWCPWCRVEHTHGVGEGHRVAHCSDGPFVDRGYFLVADDQHVPARSAKKGGR